MCGHCGCAEASGLRAAHAPSEASRWLTLHQSLLRRNDAQADRNRAHFRARGLLSLNLLSAPGSGKTALLEQLARRWPQPPIAVIVGLGFSSRSRRNFSSVHALATIRAPKAGVLDSCFSICRWMSAALKIPASVSNSRSACSSK